MVKVQIINGDQRQIVIDTKGKNKPEDIFVVGIKEIMTLNVDEKQIKKIINELPKGAQLNIVN
jgi:hypothetical protein